MSFRWKHCLPRDVIGAATNYHLPTVSAPIAEPGAGLEGLIPTPGHRCMSRKGSFLEEARRQRGSNHSHSSRTANPTSVRASSKLRGRESRDPNPPTRPQPARDVREHFDTFPGRSRRKPPISLDAVEGRSSDSWRSTLLPPWYRDWDRVRRAWGRIGSSNRERIGSFFQVSPPKKKKIGPRQGS